MVKPRINQYRIDSLEQSVRELTETVNWRKSRPLIRFDKRFWLWVGLLIEIAFKITVIYLLW